MYITTKVDRDTPLLVRMGICRDLECRHFGMHGPCRAVCPGNHRYPTRRSKHVFLPYVNSIEKHTSDGHDHANRIGKCTKCIEVGYPGMVCMPCSERGHSNVFKSVLFSRNENVFITYYGNTSHLAQSTVLKRVYTPMANSAIYVDSNTSEATTGVSTMSSVDSRATVHGLTFETPANLTDMLIEIE